MRHITLTGESAYSFSSRVFGSSRVSLHPFLTAGLSRIAEMSGEDADSLLVRQTLGPLFFFYLPKHASSLKEDLFRGYGARALRHSQLPSFGCGGSLFLKWCPRCVEQDIYERGVAYWHRVHQVPGLTACWLHQVRLMSTELKARQRLNEGLPTVVHCEAQVASSMENDVAMFSFCLLAQLEETKLGFDLEVKYRSRLNELGFITPNGSVRRKALMQALTYDLTMYPMQMSLFPRHQTDYHYISELLSVGKNCHPFRHLLLGAWLFKSVDKMFQYSTPIEEVGSHQPKDLCREEIKHHCLTLLREGYSLAAVYRKTGKSRCYLKRLAALHDIKLNLKPKQLDGELQQKIIKLAWLGVHRCRISELCSIGVGSVEQIISSEPGLTEWRKRCHWESKRRSSRASIARYLRQNRDALRRDVKCYCNVAFFWLYHNDRDWLEKSLPKATKPFPRRPS